MDELAAAVRRLDSILRPGLTAEALNGALGKVFEHAMQAPESRPCPRRAGRARRHHPARPCSFLAVGCGALVELGANRRVAPGTETPPATRRANPEQALVPILARTH